jgi:tetratricopeptide (TPR) repeat protein
MIFKKSLSVGITVFLLVSVIVNLNYQYIVSYFLLSSASFYLEKYPSNKDIDITEIIQNLEYARTINPHEILTYLRLSQAYLYLHQPRNAINVLSAATQIEPNSLLIERELIKAALLADDVELAVYLLDSFTDYQVISIMADVMYQFSSVNPNTLRSVSKRLQLDTEDILDYLEPFISQLIKENSWQSVIFWLSPIDIIYEGNVERRYKIRMRIVTAKLITGLALSEEEKSWIESSENYVYRLRGREMIRLSGENFVWLTEERGWGVFAGDSVRWNTMYWSGKSGIILDLESDGCYWLELEIKKVGDNLSFINVYVNEKAYHVVKDVPEFTENLFIHLEKPSAIVIDYLVDNGDIAIEKIEIKKSTECSR